MKNGDNEKVLSEIFSAAGKYILEGGEMPKLSGDREQVKAIMDVTIASRRLYEALLSEDSNLDVVIELSKSRRSAATAFEKIIGTTWRL